MNSALRTPIHRAALACTALCIAALGCTAPLGPVDIVGTYVASRIAGAPLPAEQTMPDAVRFVIADTLHIAADGRGTWVEVSEISNGLTPPFHVPRTRWFSVERRGSQPHIVAGEACGSIGECPAPQRHLLTPLANSMYLRVDDQIRQYERVASAP